MGKIPILGFLGIHCFLSVCFCFCFFVLFSPGLVKPQGCESEAASTLITRESIQDLGHIESKQANDGRREAAL